MVLFCHYFQNDMIRKPSETCTVCSVVGDRCAKSNIFISQFLLNLNQFDQLDKI